MGSVERLEQSGWVCTTQTRTFVEHLEEELLISQEKPHSRRAAAVSARVAEQVGEGPAQQRRIDRDPEVVCLIIERHAITGAVQELCHEVADVNERVDFAERLLAKRGDIADLPGSERAEA